MLWDACWLYTASNGLRGEGEKGELRVRVQGRLKTVNVKTKD